MVRGARGGFNADVGLDATTLSAQAVAGRVRGRQDMRFEDRVALITAAGSGIGRATAQIIAAEGGRVAAVDNDEGRLERLANDVSAGGGRIGTFACDALDRGAVRATVAGVLEAHGCIDILVNAVGGSTIIADPGATVDALGLEEWRSITAFNLEGMFLFTHEVVPIMKRQGRGKIVNLASIAGRGLSDESSSAYAAAKGGVIAFTHKIARELGPFGITVNAVAPNTTLTERIRPRWEQRSPEVRAAIVDAIPLRRVGEAVDQARVICFLASGDADYVTGQTIDVSGGAA